MMGLPLVLKMTMTMKTISKSLHQNDGERTAQSHEEQPTPLRVGGVSKMQRRPFDGLSSLARRATLNLGILR
jgi:hypothetical protein